MSLLYSRLHKFARTPLFPIRVSRGGFSTKSFLREGHGEAKVSHSISLLCSLIADPRLERGQYCVSMLEDMRGIPDCNTVDWMPGVGNDSEGIMASNGCTK